MGPLFSAADVQNAYSLDLSPVANGAKRAQQVAYQRQILEREQAERAIAGQEKAVGQLDRLYNRVNLATGTPADALAVAETNKLVDETTKFIQGYKGGDVVSAAYAFAGPKMGAIESRQAQAAALKKNLDSAQTEYAKQADFYNYEAMNADALHEAIFDEKGGVRPYIDASRDYLGERLADPSKAARYANPELARKSFADSINAQDPEERIETFRNGNIELEQRYSARPFQRLNAQRSAVELATDKDLEAKGIPALRPEDLSQFGSSREFAYLTSDARSRLDARFTASPNSETAKTWSTLDDDAKNRVAGYSVLSNVGPMKGTKVEAAKSTALFNEFQQERRFQTSEARADRREALSAARIARATSGTDEQSKRSLKAWASPLGVVLAGVYTDPTKPEGAQARSALPRANVEVTRAGATGATQALAAMALGKVTKAPSIPMYDLTAMNENKFIKDPVSGRNARVYISEYDFGMKRNPTIVYEPVEENDNKQWVPVEGARRTVSGDAFLKELSSLAPSLGVSSADFRDIIYPLISK